MKFLSTVLVFALLVSFAALAQTLANPTQEEMIGVLSNVWVLYGLMILGTVASQLKQVGVAQQEGATVTTLGHIFRLREWIVLGITNTLSFAGLIYMGQLTFVSAVSIGFVLNELVDLDPTSSRSNALTTKG